MPANVGDARVLLPSQIARDEVVHARALLEHPMDTGFFRTAEGVPIPAYFVTEVTVTYGDEQVAHFMWTSGISRDPYVAFPIRATREALLRVVWKDNRGGAYEASAPVRFG